jgi:hypothetical protein
LFSAGDTAEHSALLRYVTGRNCKNMYRAEKRSVVEIYKDYENIKFLKLMDYSLHYLLAGILWKDLNLLFSIAPVISSMSFICYHEVIVPQIFVRNLNYLTCPTTHQLEYCNF